MGDIADAALEEVDANRMLEAPQRNLACAGECEGTGLVPVYMSAGDIRFHWLHRPPDEQDPRLITLWKEAEGRRHANYGWHWVLCPVCGRKAEVKDDDA